MENVINEISKETCCGCGACINVCTQGALKYSTDKYGFTIPVIDTNVCSGCGRCSTVCPNVKSTYNITKVCYAALNKNKDDRKKSSSGGIFGAFAYYIVESGGVVYGAKMDENFKVIHSRIDNKVHLDQLFKSKYVQSFMGDIYCKLIKDLESGKKVLFSGTPCQVAAIKNVVPIKYQNKLYLIDVVCHGVPSQAFFDSYIKYLSGRKGEITSYQFRTKKHVNNGMNCFFSYKIGDGRFELRNWPEDVYNYLYMKSYIYRDSCYCCKYAKEERPGDISLCDYWNWVEYHDEFPHGSTLSAVLINTRKGEDIFNEVKDNLEYSETKIENVIKHNGCLSYPSEKPIERERLLDCWLQEGFNLIDDYYKSHNKLFILRSRIVRYIPTVIMNSFFEIKYGISKWRLSQKIKKE